ncbi:MAG TPA: YraN family protein [Motiliproteus sp.]
MSRRIGQQKEAQAEQYLQRHGLTTLARNYLGPHGEIDLIMRDSSTLVFVEVRFRRGQRFASAAESIDRRKQQRLIATAEGYLLQNPALRNQPCRFDVLACDGDNACNWIKNAFEA